MDTTQRTLLLVLALGGLVHPPRLEAAFAIHRSALSARPSSLSAHRSALAQKDDKDKKPSLSLKASPTISFSPARIFLTAELKGGPDDYADYYCPTVEWDWGDGTRSEATVDCEPYEAGKSEIKRRFVVEHVYRQAGNYRVQFRLKKHNRPIVAASTTVQIKPGFRDPSIGH